MRTTRRACRQFFNRMRPDAEKMRGLYDAWMSYNEIDLGKDAGAPERALCCRDFTCAGRPDEAGRSGFLRVLFLARQPGQGRSRDDACSSPTCGPCWRRVAPLRPALSATSTARPPWNRARDGYACATARSGICCRRTRDARSSSPSAGSTGTDRASTGGVERSRPSRVTGVAQNGYDEELQKDDYVIGATILPPMAGVSPAIRGWGSFPGPRLYRAGRCSCAGRRQAFHLDPNAGRHGEEPVTGEPCRGNVHGPAGVYAL